MQAINAGSSKKAGLFFIRCVGKNKYSGGISRVVITVLN